MSNRRVSSPWSLPQRGTGWILESTSRFRLVLTKQVSASLTWFGHPSREPSRLCPISWHPPKVLPSEAQGWRGLGLAPRRTAAGAGCRLGGPVGPPWLRLPSLSSCRSEWVRPGHRGPGAGSGWSSGPPVGSRHLHLAAVPHASLGMEVMEEIPEGETFHFQACLEDSVQQLPVLSAPAVSELLGVHAPDPVQV